MLKDTKTIKYTNGNYHNKQFISQITSAKFINQTVRNYSCQATWHSNIIRIVQSSGVYISKTSLNIAAFTAGTTFYFLLPITICNHVQA